MNTKAKTATTWNIKKLHQHFHVLLATSPGTANVCNVVGPHEGRDVFSGGRRAAGVL
jgi:hypothetical protein